MSCSQLGITFYLLDGILELGVVSWNFPREEVPTSQVLSLDKVRPYPIGVLVQFPDPFKH
jgi:hypothetical protein